MQFQVSFKVNEFIYLRDPETSEIGKQIIKNAIDLIYELGFEQFTFKKLATQVQTTEATIYRYFENKHRLLLYILNWYWSYMEFLVDIKLMNIHDKKEKLKMIISLFTQELPESKGQYDYNKKYLNHIVIVESSKTYYVKEVAEINKNQVFKSYKDLCARVAAIIQEFNPKYPYPKSLSTTIIETSHYHQYFCDNLPKLTDCTPKNASRFTGIYLEQLVFKVLS